MYTFVNIPSLNDPINPVCIRLDLITGFGYRCKMTDVRDGDKVQVDGYMVKAGDISLIVSKETCDNLRTLMAQYGTRFINLDPEGLKEDARRQRLAWLAAIKGGDSIPAAPPEACPETLRSEQSMDDDRAKQRREELKRAYLKGVMAEDLRDDLVGDCCDVGINVGPDESCGIGTHPPKPIPVSKTALLLQSVKAKQERRRLEEAAGIPQSQSQSQSPSLPSHSHEVSLYPTELLDSVPDGEGLDPRIRIKSYTHVVNAWEDPTPKLLNDPRQDGEGS